MLLRLVHPRSVGGVFGCRIPCFFFSYRKPDKHSPMSREEFLRGAMGGFVFYNTGRREGSDFGGKKEEIVTVRCGTVGATVFNRR